MKEANPEGIIKRAWRRLGEIAEAMDTTEVSHMSDRIDILEKQVFELETWRSTASDRAARHTDSQP